VFFHDFIVVETLFSQCHFIVSFVLSCCRVVWRLIHNQQGRIKSLVSYLLPLGVLLCGVHVVLSCCLSAESVINILLDFLLLPLFRFFAAVVNVLRLGKNIDRSAFREISAERAKHDLGSFFRTIGEDFQVSVIRNVGPNYKVFVHFVLSVLLWLSCCLATIALLPC